MDFKMLKTGEVKVDCVGKRLYILEKYRFQI